MEHDVACYSFNWKKIHNLNTKKKNKYLNKTTIETKYVLKS